MPYGPFSSKSGDLSDLALRETTGVGRRRVQAGGPTLRSSFAAWDLFVPTHDPRHGLDGQRPKPDMGQLISSCASMARLLTDSVGGALGRAPDLRVKQLACDRAGSPVTQIHTAQLHQATLRKINITEPVGR